MSREKATRDKALATLTKEYPEYDFSETVYKGVFKHMEARCKSHGLFTTTYFGLIHNCTRTCPECREVEKVKRRRLKKLGATFHV